MPARRGESPGTGAVAAAPRLSYEGESHLGAITQLTLGGENAEAYWSHDATQLVFQSTRPPFSCDQIMRMPAAGGPPTLVSTGHGRTTCAYFLPGDQEIIYSSTDHRSPACPAPPDRSHGYVWGLFDYDIFRSKPDGSGRKQLTDRRGYDAEATVCARDGTIIFTSDRDGDLELYRMDANGDGVTRLTHAPGYDGGAFFSADCKKIVWRASRPQGDELADYKRLLANKLVRPTRLELFVANADGSDAHQVTYLGAASFAPYFFPSGERIIFSSNYGDPGGREFDLWAVGANGTALERITHAPGFDGFPVFSPDGRKLAFASNRNQRAPGETDVYVATWIDSAPNYRHGAADRFFAAVRWLADDAREGRGVGTAGLAAAGEWLVAQLQAIGVEPAGEDGGFTQMVEARTGVEAGDGNELIIDGQPVAQSEFTPTASSAVGAAAGRTVFVGYGLAEDYEKVRARGRIAVARRFVPRREPYSSERLRRMYSDLGYKAFVAREHKARALVIVDIPEIENGEKLPREAPLPVPRPADHGNVGIPVVVVTRRAGAKLLEGEHRVSLRADLRVVKQPSANIVAKISAAAANRLPGVVVVGAHYDHLGYGQQGSLEADPKVRIIHNGADDNASGTAALLEVARLLVEASQRLRRDVYLVAFTAEEVGLIGSSAFSRFPPDGLTMRQVVAMLNMDMVGRMRDNRLFVLGGESAREWPEITTAACERAQVRCQIGGGGYGPSDQTPFFALGVPVLHFFTGSHGDYHRASDDVAKINAIGAARVAQIVADVALAAANRNSSLTYRRAPEPLPRGDLPGPGASLGTIPDYAAAEEGTPGVVLSGVRPGGPADKAKLRRGDRIVAIDGVEIRTVRDLMYVLQAAEPGQRAAITVLRAGARIQVEAVYGPPRRRF